MSHLAFGDRHQATRNRAMFRNDTGTREHPANQHRGRGDDGGLIWRGRDKMQGCGRPFSDKTAAGRDRPADVLTQLGEPPANCWQLPANLVRLRRRWHRESGSNARAARNVGIQPEPEQAQSCASARRNALGDTTIVVVASARLSSGGLGTTDLGVRPRRPRSVPAPAYRSPVVSR
jgi:hypothetical protein